MDQEQQAIAEGDRALKAKTLLENPLLRNAFDDLRSDFRKAWEDSSDQDAEGRERLFLALKILNKVEKSLEEHVQTGKLAARTLEDIHREGKKRGSFF